MSDRTRNNLTLFSTIMSLLCCAGAAWGYVVVRNNDLDHITKAVAELRNVDREQQLKLANDHDTITRLLAQLEAMQRTLDRIDKKLP